MGKKKISLNDIAKRLNISKTTVSLIVNGKAKENRISASLVARVEQMVTDMGYRPNSFARGLRMGKSNIIGLMVEDISDPFFGAIAKYIEDRAFQSGYNLIYCSTENRDDRAREFLEIFRNLGVDGYIIAPSPGIGPVIRSMVEQGETFLLFDRYFEGITVDSVTVDNEEGTYHGTQHLVNQGYRRIAFYTITSLQSQMKHRLAGYRRAMREAGLSENIVELPYYRDFRRYTEEITRMLKGSIEDLDSILFSTNYLGIRGLQALVDLGVDIPGQLAVLCFDDNYFFRMFSPTVSVISQPVEELSLKMIETLLGRLSGKDKAEKAAKIVLPTELRVRESTQPGPRP